MKSPLIALAALAGVSLAAQSSFAQVTISQDPTPKSRAEVKSEAASAQKAGTIEKGAAVPKPIPQSSGKPRAEAKAEAAAAQKAGTVEKGPAVPKPTKTTSDVSRAEVKQEAAAAQKAGEVGKGPDVKK